MNQGHQGEKGAIMLEALGIETRLECSVLGGPVRTRWHWVFEVQVD